LAWERRGQSCQTQGRGWAVPERRRGGERREGRGSEGRRGERPETLQDICKHLNTVLQSAVKCGRI